MKKQNTHTAQQGFIAFITILIIGAVVVVVTVSTGMQGVGGLKNALSFTKNAQTSASARGCIDLALLKLRYQPTYTGENIQIGEVNCVIQIINLDVNRYGIQVSAVSIGTPQHRYSIQVAVLRRGFSVNVINWQEGEI